MFVWVIKMLQYERIDDSEELTLINQISQKNVWFVIIGILKILVLSLSQMFVINVMILYQVVFYCFVAG